MVRVRLWDTVCSRVKVRDVPKQAAKEHPTKVLPLDSCIESLLDDAETYAHFVSFVLFSYVLLLSLRFLPSCIFFLFFCVCVCVL